MLIKQQWFTCDGLGVQIVIILGGEIAKQRRSNVVGVVVAEPWMSRPWRFLAMWVLRERESERDELNIGI